MTDEIRQIQPEDPEVGEEWLRETTDPDVRGVYACKIDAMGGWQVTVSAMEFIRSDPLETELRQRIANALRAVAGVNGADEDDREAWLVTGNPEGRPLVEAVAAVVDSLADQIRDYLPDEAEF